MYRLTRSIQGRLTVALLAGGGVLVLAGALALWLEITAERRSDFDRTLAAEGRAVASLLAVTTDGLRLDYAEELMPEFSALSNPAYFEIRRRDGTLVEASESLGNSVLGPTRMPAQNETVDDVTLPSGEPGRRITLLVAPLRREADERRDEARGEHVEEPPVDAASAIAYVAVARSRVPLDVFLARLRWGIATWAALMLAGTVMVIVAALRWGFRPLARVAHEIEHLDVETLSRRLGEEGLPLELRPFVQRVNGLLLRLERSFERERDFSANVAHELRTPLAELRSLCDVALASPAANAGLTAFFADARAVGLSMERIVDTLLGLRASESSPATTRREVVALRAALEQSWAPFAGLAAERGVALRLDFPAEMAVSTDREKLTLILSNLLSNAASHAAHGTWVEVRARRVPEGTALTIANPAPDLTPADVERVFDRFWRKTAARESDGHLGLGLPLAAGLARALGIALGAALTPAGVFELTLQLPVLQEP